MNPNSRIARAILLICAGTVILGMNLRADGMIVVPDPPPHRPHHGRAPFPLQVKYHHVAVEIHEQLATTAIDQVFFNPTAHRLEGYYLFPLPEGAAIDRFSMEIDGRQAKAELLDAGKAQRIYEDIVRRMRDPALLEYLGRGVYRVRIFPIEPRSEKRIRLSYSETLRQDNRLIEYRYPLNTEKFSSRPLREVSITANIHARGGLKSVYCPTHPVDVVRRKPNHMIASWEARSVTPDRDFRLFVLRDERSLGATVLTFRPRGDDGFFFLNITPDISFADRRILAKDLVFVLDVSGSMAGKKLDQAKAALEYCVHRLTPRDRFNIIRFSTEAEALFPSLRAAGREHVDLARRFIRGLEAIGGTNIDEALTLALRMDSGSGRMRAVLFLTDGKPTIGEIDEERLRRKIDGTNREKVRIFTFGIGDEINTHLLDKITSDSRAVRSYISPSEDIEVTVSSLFQKIQYPVLTDISLRFRGAIDISKLYPKQLPDLFKGSSLNLFGRYRGAGKSTLILEGIVAGEKRRFTFPVSDAFLAQPSEDLRYGFIASLWAARRIGYLLDVIRLRGESRELKDEIVHLSRKYGIITPYTSYLVVEDEERRVASGEIDVRDQTLAPHAQQDSDLRRRNREEFDALGKKSGRQSVHVSEEAQDLATAANSKQMVQGSGRLNYTGRDGRQRNLLQQVKHIQGRAVYNNGRYWVDAHVQNAVAKQTVRIRFAGPAYFQLLKEKPQAKDFMALGRNVRFVIDDILYIVSE